MYKKNILREYIQNSELRIFSDKLRVRLSKELAEKYDNGAYNNYLNNIEKYYNMLNSLNIKYPSNANPILYIYIVPDDNFEDMLQIPKTFSGNKGGGKPVGSYNLDGFKTAYGVSQNCCENLPQNITSISYIENEIHELSHLIHGMFFSRNSIINEGIAEAIPLYVMGIEEEFDEHREALLNMNESQIYSAREILNQEKNREFGKEALLPNKSCSFRLSYISSYLFIRVCLETIEEKFGFNKIESLQFFLEMIMQSSCFGERLIYDIADTLDIDREELLSGKSLQLKIISNFESYYDVNELVNVSSFGNLNVLKILRFQNQKNNKNETFGKR